MREAATVFSLYKIALLNRPMTEDLEIALAILDGVEDPLDAELESILGDDLPIASPKKRVKFAEKLAVVFTFDGGQSPKYRLNNHSSTSKLLQVFIHSFNYLDLLT